MINELLQHTLAASHQLVTLDDATINRILIDTASALLTRQAEVLAANVEDLSRMDPANPKYDRLKLTEERLAGIAGDMKNVASRSGGRSVQTAGSTPCLVSTSWIIATKARLELSASEPPFNTQAFPLLKQREKTSKVTFGRAS